MVNTLVTYLPFSRFFEVEKHFVKNVELLKPKRSYVYVDDVFTSEQQELLKRFLSGLELRCGYWRNRSSCFMKILMDLKKEDEDALIVDSDVLLDERFGLFDSAILECYDFYSFIEYNSSLLNKFQKRSVLLESLQLGNVKVNVYGYSLFGRGDVPFNVGPKLAMRFGSLKKLKDNVLADIYDAMHSIPPHLRNEIGDETPIAIALYYSGYRVNPYVEGVRHAFDQRREPKRVSRIDRMLKVSAHVEFAKILLRKGYREVFWLYGRYKLAQIKHGLPILFGV